MSAPPLPAGVDRLAEAVLHEGYLLYPYRRSAYKNQRHRFPFGTLFPASFCAAHDPSEASSLRLELPVVARDDGAVVVRLRFLQPLVDAETEATVREVVSPVLRLSALVHAPHTERFEFPDAPSAGQMTITAQPVQGVFKLTVRVENLATPPDTARSRDEALAWALASSHLLVSAAEGARLVSVIDPPPALAALARACRSEGTYPVLAGPAGCEDTVLSAPIILYDHAAIAAESRGDFFDGTEMDEMLTLRLVTLTAEERRALPPDPKVRAVLARADASLDGALMDVHGTWRAGHLQPGHAVRLRPRPRGDILDLALAGRRATVQAVERDFEGRLHVAVVVDDDPGKDLGVHGHRFFFAPDEVEPL